MAGFPYEILNSDPTPLVDADYDATVDRLVNEGLAICRMMG